VIRGGDGVGSCPASPKKGAGWSPDSSRFTSDRLSVTLAYGKFKQEGQFHDGDPASARTAAPPLRGRLLIHTLVILLSPAPIVWFMVAMGCS